MVTPLEGVHRLPCPSKPEALVHGCMGAGMTDDNQCKWDSSVLREKKSLSFEGPEGGTVHGGGGRDGDAGRKGWSDRDGLVQGTTRDMRSMTPKDSVLR